jgi:Ca-activated chloride channel homolog
MNTVIETDRDLQVQGCGGRLVSVDGRTLPLESTALGAEAGGGIARAVLRQTFRNKETVPLEVVYTFPLPAEGAVAGYEVRIDGRRVIGRIERREAARRQFETALLEGRSAGLVDQERANLFTQRLGNVPPGAEVVVELRIDQKLRWLAEGSWEWRFPTVTAPRYLGAAGRVSDADDVSVEVADRDTGVRASLDLVLSDTMPAGGVPTSRSHAIAAERSGPGGSGVPGGTSVPGGTDGSGPVRVTLAAESGAALDRDIVVRWPVARPESGITLGRARPDAGAPHGGQAYGLVTIVPPEGPGTPLSRDLVLLIDTSGSMRGRPLDLAKVLVKRLIESLGPQDRLEMIAFSMEPRRWSRHPAEATPAVRARAAAWVDGLAAGGGTEMTRAVVEALQPLRKDAPRQVVLVTDGQVGFEAEVFRSIRDHLPEGSRLHAIGVGSQVNCALLGPAARAGGGVEVIVDLDDDPAAGAERIVAATRDPVLAAVVVEGDAVTGHAPRRLPDLHAGRPILASVRLRPEGGRLTVRARSSEGTWTRTIDVPTTAAGEGLPAVTTLYGREAVEDLELDRAAGAEASEIDAAVERLGLEFGLATRLTSWIAISEVTTVDPRQPAKVVRIPQELPYGLSAEGLGLRARGLAPTVAHMAMAMDQVSLADQLLPAGAPMERALGGPRPSRTLAQRLGWRFKTKRADDQRGRIDIEPPAPGEPFGPPAVSSHAVHEFIKARWVDGPEPGTRVLRFEVEGTALAWKPETKALILTWSRAQVEVEVVAALTTIAGSLEPGTRVTLGLRLGDIEPAEVLGVLIVSDGRTLLLNP